MSTINRCLHAWGAGAVALAVALTLWPAASPARGQSLSRFDRDRGRGMLKVIKGDLRKNYYDPRFRGIDLEARFAAADEKIDHAQSIGQVFAIIAQVLLDFNDSHTFFTPPGVTARFEYGWQEQMVGDCCLVTAVKPGSDAEAKRVKVGDQVGGFRPTRDLFWKFN